MKKFSFRLEKLLGLARRKEEFARNETARALAGVNRAEDALVEIQDRVRALNSDLGLAVGHLNIGPRNVQIMHTWLATATLQQQQLEQQLKQEEEAFEQARTEMIERRKELLSIEKAREKAYQAWQQEMLKTELADMEEIASYRHLMQDRIAP